MESGGRGSDSPLVGGKDGLIVLLVLCCHLFFHPFRNRRFPEGEKRLLEVLVASIIQEPEGTPPRCRVVDHFCHKTFILSEIELVAYPYLPCRVHDDIPQPLLPVELPEQEHLDVRSCLLFLPVEPGREDFRVIEDKSVTLSEIIYDFLENPVLYLSCIPEIWMDMYWSGTMAGLTLLPRRLWKCPPLSVGPDLSGGGRTS